VEVKSRKVVSLGGLTTLQAAGNALGLTYWQVRGLVQREQVPTVKLGNALLVSIEQLEKAGQHERAIRA
jgi:hypothetical protein